VVLCWFQRSNPHFCVLRRWVDIQALVASMTLEEKVAQIGSNTAPAISRLNIPAGSQTLPLPLTHITTDSGLSLLEPLSSFKETTRLVFGRGGGNM
jgi:hypothetical protein